MKIRRIPAPGFNTLVPSFEIKICAVTDAKDSDEESDEDNFDSDDEDPETASDLVEGDIAVPDVSIKIIK